ncbi:MAG: TlpA disulfide reductase family protein [Pyrinomonadaceae bacterium]
MLRVLAKAALCVAFASTIPAFGLGQIPDKGAKSAGPKSLAALPKVTQIDTDGLKKLLKPNGKPLLINFWATWCDPCREEFPDLVKLDAAYKGKLDFITVSLDDLADIKTYVPKFLGEMNAEMPAYLLKTADESAAIAMVAKDWNGNLPLTILFAATGEAAYVRKGKIRFETVTTEIDKVIAAQKTTP